MMKFGCFKIIREGDFILVKINRAHVKSRLKIFQNLLYIFLIFFHIFRVFYAFNIFSTSFPIFHGTRTVVNSLSPTVQWTLSMPTINRTILTSGISMHQTNPLTPYLQPIRHA